MPGDQWVAQIRKKQCDQNTCVGEQCDIRGCDCEEDSYSYQEKQIYISIYLFTNNTDISLVGGGGVNYQYSKINVMLFFINHLLHEFRV